METLYFFEKSDVGDRNWAVARGKQDSAWQLSYFYESGVAFANSDGGRLIK